MGAAALLVVSINSIALAAPPPNDSIAGATPLKIGAPVEYDSSLATKGASDPTTCTGSHGTWSGPYYASVWFSYTATAADKWLWLDAPTMQGHPKDYLAISFVYARTSSGLQLIDCVAYGNDTHWQATAGTTYLIMEAGLDASVTDEPGFSNKGGHGSIVLLRGAENRVHYTMRTSWAYDCGDVHVEGTGTNQGMFKLKNGRQGDPTPYFFDNYSWTALTRNPANGKWFVETGNGLYKDLHITNSDGTVYQFVAQETGRPYMLTTGDGRRILADHGRLLVTFQVDTHGDADLSNDEFIDDSWQLLSENGDHPGFFFEGDWCEDFVIPLLG
jgi:hypothetical protein